MSNRRSKADGEHAAFVPLGGHVNSAGGSLGTRLSVTTASAALTAGRITANAKYKVGLDPTSGGACFCKFASSASLPASDAAEAEGFWLMPGECEIVFATTNQLAGILTAGTGTLYFTRLES